MDQANETGDVDPPRDKRLDLVANSECTNLDQVVVVSVMEQPVVGDAEAPPAGLRVIRVCKKRGGTGRLVHRD